MKRFVGWKSVFLQDVAEVRSGLSISSSRQGKFVKKPYLRVANVQNGFLDLSEIKEIEVPINQIDRFVLRPGDLLLIEGNGNPSNLGRGCIWAGQIPDCVHQNHIFAVRTLHNADLLPDFLMLQLQSMRGRSYLLSCAKSSSGLATLNSQQLKKFPVILPPLSKQHEIVEILRTWDEAIEKLEALRSMKVVRARAIEQYLFEAEYKSLNRLYRTRDIFEPVSERGRPDLPLLAVMQDLGVVRRDELDRRVVMPDGDISAYKVVRPGDFVVSLRSFEGGLEQSGIIGLVSPAYTILRPTERLVGEYYRLFFKSRSFISRLDKVIFGIRDGKQIAFRDLGDVLIPFPSHDHQQKQAEALAAIHAEIVLLNRQLDTLSLQKRGLMQKLLTGELRVPDAAVSLSPAAD